MITSKLVNSSGTAVQMFVSSESGGAISTPGNPGQDNAITCMILCNNYDPVDLTNEDEGSCEVSIYLKKVGIGTLWLIVNKLIVPASETVFLSEERIILDAGDEIHVATSVADRIVFTVSTLPV